jgi:RNA 2',3'-cyclic 3'-phosphodiesterase
MNERWRCFVAIPLTEPFRADLATLVDRWRGHDPQPPLRWTDPSTWHLTLAFLGDVAADDVPTLVGRLRELVRGPGYGLVASDVVAWPRAQATQMIWWRFRRAPRLIELHDRICADLSVVERRRYRPHLTLARAPGGRAVDIGPLAQGLSAPPAHMPAEQVVLYRSHLGAAGATYEALAAVPWGMMAP